MHSWKIYNKKADFAELAKKHDIDMVVARIIINRDIAPEDFDAFLKPSKDGIYDENLMKDVDLAVSILKDSISSGKKFRVIGDYDIDGICATYILKKGLGFCGANVDHSIPHRIEDGYGINKSLVQKAIDDGIDIIVTCDNGISAPDVVAMAKENGITVIVTDHHRIPEDEGGNQLLPPADAVINPHRNDCMYPFKEICGAVVAWKLIIALYKSYGMECRDAYDFIEFAAFATVGDIMPLIDENRCLVHLGLKKLRHTKNVGMRTLIGLLGLEGEALSAYHLGFVLGPCINASGRLDSADRSLALLEESDPFKAREIAAELISLNEERKELTVEGIQSALELIEKEGLDNNHVLVVYLPKLHESLCGIVAGRLREKYTRPCFVLTDGENDIKGSGRSIPEYSMFEKMQECKELFLQFGGHPMAAGLRIERDRLHDFIDSMNNKCGLCQDDLVEKVMIDVPMPVSYITTELVYQIEGLEPFGNGNSKPVFAQKEVVFSGATYIGKQNSYLKFFIPLEGHSMEALYFGESDKVKEEVETVYGEEFWNRFISSRDTYLKMDIVYYPQINRYKNMESVQIIIKHFKVSEIEGESHV